MRVTILAFAFALFTSSAIAQSIGGGRDTFRDSAAPPWDPWSWPTNSHGPTDPLAPASASNQAFPVHITLRVDNKHFNYFWSDFRGHGRLVADNTLYKFSYECPDTFREPNQFQARWSSDRKKLDVLLQKPDSSHTEICTLKILNHS